MLLRISAVQCERKPLVLDQKTLQQQQQLMQQHQQQGEIAIFNRNKTIGLDYQTSSDESDEDKISRISSTSGIIESNKNATATNGDLMAVDKVQKNFTRVVDRVDEEGGKALLHLSQSCKRRTAISFNSDDSSSDFGTVKTESLSDEAMVINHSTIGEVSGYHNASYTTTYPAYTDKPIRTSCSNSNNDHFQQTMNNNNITKTRDLFKNGHTVRYGSDLLPGTSNHNLNQQHHRFELEAPSISTTDVGYLYEISTRLLFVTIEWVQSLDSFQKLSKKDQCNLLLNKWHSLFVLGMAQSSSMFPISTMLFLANVNNDKRLEEHKSHDNQESETTTTTTSPTTPLPWSTFVKLKNVVLNGNFIGYGELSRTIYDYMKMVTLFDTGTVCILLYVFYFLLLS